MTQCQFHVAFKRSMSIREPAHLKDALFGGCGVVGWADCAALTCSLRNQMGGSSGSIGMAYDNADRRKNPSRNDE